jgi:hypothetical protein
MPRILVITSCTNSKTCEIGEGPVEAQELYSGEQHTRLMRGVATYRAAGEPAGRLDLRIVSAGLGLLKADELVHGYEQTFDGMPPKDARLLANELGLPAALQDAMEAPLRLGLLLLGKTYLRACALPEDLTPGGPMMAIVTAASTRWLPAAITPALTGVADLKRFGAGHMAVKGEIGGRALALLARDPAAVDRLATGDLVALAELRH